MTAEVRTVEVFGARSGRGRYLPMVVDPSTGQYFAPVEDPTKVGIGSRSRFVIAVLDTGMLLKHPRIRRNLVHSVDFTGEGPDDLNGHGTLVTLLLLHEAPEIRLINVKVLDAEGLGRAKHLEQGIEWCVANREKYRITALNLSAGVFHKKWGVFGCTGRCSLCRAAERAAHAGINIVAAAGNSGPDEIPCPQKIGLQDQLFLVVAAGDIETRLVTGYSGMGNVMAPEARVRMVAVEDPA